MLSFDHLRWLSSLYSSVEIVYPLFNLSTVLFRFGLWILFILLSDLILNSLHVLMLIVLFVLADSVLGQWMNFLSRCGD